MTTKPLIGVTTFLKPYDTELGLRHEEVLDRSYVDMIVQVGGIPVLLPTLPVEDAARAIANLDGILLSGGEDDEAREAFESRLVTIASEQRIPLLGVCRGIQILNLALGGTLRRDIPDHCADNGSMRIREISITATSKFSNIVGSRRATVACWHHHAVGDIADDLQVSGLANDGVVEVVEHRSRPIIGVQWHPELLPESPEAKRVINWLISTAMRRTPTGTV